MSVTCTAPLQGGTGRRPHLVTELLQPLQPCFSVYPLIKRVRAASLTQDAGCLWRLLFGFFTPLLD